MAAIHYVKLASKVSKGEKIIAQKKIRVERLRTNQGRI